MRDLKTSRLLFKTNKTHFPDSHIHTHTPDLSILQTTVLFSCEIRVCPECHYIPAELP